MGARTLFVAVDGNDQQQEGSSARPFRTIQKAADTVKPGDRVSVRPGVYRERVTMRTSGLGDAPIVFEGKPGATIDGGDRFSGWKAAPEIGSGVYKKAGPPYEPACMSWNSKCLVVLSRATMGSGGGLGLLAREPSDPFWDGIEATCGTKDGVAYVRFRQRQDPAREDITFAPANVGTVYIDGADHVILRGFTIRNGWSQVWLGNGASDNIVEHNVLLGGHITVYLQENVARNQIRHNEITLNYIYDDIGGPRERDATYFAVWNRIYNGYSSQAYGICVEYAGSDNQIHHNHIYKHFDALMEWCAALSYRITEETQERDRPRLAEYNQRLKVHHNHIHHNCDEGLNLFGGNVRAEYHDNLIYENLKNISIRTPGTGPCYIYRNRVYSETERGRDGNPVGSGVRTYSQNLPTNYGTYYIYHNSFSAGHYTLRVASAPDNPARRGLPNFWLINNLCSSYRFWATDDWALWGKAGFMGAHAAHNWIGDSDPSGDWTTWAGWPQASQNVTADQVRLLQPTNCPSFRLAVDSPARGIGLDLSKPFELDGVRHGPLPGMRPRYFAGPAPDVGALQYGEGAVVPGPEAAPTEE